MYNWNKNQDVIETIVTEANGEVPKRLVSPEEMLELKSVIAANKWVPADDGPGYEIKEGDWRLLALYYNNDYICIVFNIKTGACGALSPETSKVLYERAQKLNTDN